MAEFDMQAWEATVANIGQFMRTIRTLSDVLAERLRQNEKWGEQNHDAYRWLAILSEDGWRGSASSPARRIRWQG